MKTQIALEKKTTIDTFCVMPPVLPLEVSDLCSVIGNLLDNAIEAAEKVPEEKRFIKLRLANNREMWEISVSNSTTGEYRRQGETLLSTKGKGRQGQGLRIVERIVDANHGILGIRPEEEVFNVTILLPWGNDSNSDQV